MRLGTEADLKVCLQGMGFSGRLNTAFIERVNLTVRHGVAALARRTWATAQQSAHLLAHLEWWRAYYHCVRPHASLRMTLVQPREPPGDGRLARCSLTHCRRFPLESHRSQMGLQCHVASKSVNGQQKNSA